MWHLIDSGIPCGIIAHNGDSALPSLLLSLSICLCLTLSPHSCELPQMRLRNRRLIGRTPLWGMVYCTCECPHHFITPHKYVSPLHRPHT
ncbi:hypothetical protein WN943_025759 [Citrus x changshan-huyou]